MAEQDKNLLDAAREAIGNSDILGKAKEMLNSGAAANVLGDPEELKRKLSEVGKAITPDALDDKVEQVVGAAVDMIAGKLGGDKPAEGDQPAQ